MSPPVRDLDDGPSKDGPLNYAPKKVRRPAPDLTPADAHREGDAAPQNAVPESGQLPWKRSKRREPFVGDVAAVELRNKLALAPHRLPEPPPSTGVKYGLASRHSILANLNRDCRRNGRHRPRVRSNPRTPHSLLPWQRPRSCHSPANESHAMPRRRELHLRGLGSIQRGRNRRTRPPGWRFRLPMSVPTQPW